MAEVGLGDWRFEAAADDASGPDRVVWTFKLKRYAGGEVRSFLPRDMLEGMFRGRRPITPRNDFMNWAVWEGGAYDYAADQKGYTDGVAVDFNQQAWAFRLGYFLEPKFSNSHDLDTLLFQRGGYQAEIEKRYAISSKPGKFHVLGFVNRALMGSYSQTLMLPDLNIAEIRKDRFTTGVVLNLEQAIGDDLGVFARFSYNDGSNEIMSFTDIDRGGLLGISLKGGR